ncbi:hypothetical protein ILYODFUR_004355 [Ilyodon furcidens]|uniref:Uncharacterized protein n=1 Tax=Ilyodon furcidens TaxID=33524 RepID=A0ABV0V338_9TELE
MHSSVSGGGKAVSWQGWSLGGIRLVIWIFTEEERRRFNEVPGRWRSISVKGWSRTYCWRGEEFAWERVRASFFECAMLEGGQVGEQEFGFLEVCTQSGWAGDGNL